MALDVGKVIDGLKLSYGQLRNLLITSIGAVATVWLVGNKVGGMTTKMDMMLINQKEIKIELVDNRTMVESGLNRIYTDFATINKTNNDLWNSKFTLLLEYGDGNKELLKKLLEYEDKRAEASRQEVVTKKEYDVVAEPVEKKNRSGSVSFVPIGEDGNPEGEELNYIYGEDGNLIRVDTIKHDLSIGVKKKDE